MIQRIGSRARLARASTRWLLLAGAVHVSACSGGPPGKVVRTLGGSTAHGAFVPPGSYEAYVRGELLLTQGRPHEAAAQLELANTAPEEDAYLLSRLAYAQLLSGDRAEASRTLDHAAELDRCAEAVWLMRGTLAESSQELAVARAAYEKATQCAPASSRGELAIVRLLVRQGETAAAMDVLTRAAERSAGEREVAKSALRHSLAEADAATLAHALDGLGAGQAAGSEAIEQGITLALDRNLPRLALRLRAQHKPRLPVALEARLLSANGLSAELATLLAQNDAEAFGGHASAARLALDAHSYERAELEATSALQLQSTDAMRAVRARAALALGRSGAALPDVVAVQDEQLRILLLTEALASVGAKALARELAALGTSAPRAP